MCVTRRHENEFWSFSSSLTLHRPPICNFRPKSNQTNPSQLRVCVTRRHRVGVLGEWAASIESLAADLLVSSDFGLFWFVVELGIEFKGGG